MEKCSLKYKAVVGLSSLSPIQMLHVNAKSLVKRFSKLMETLIDLGHVFSESADKAKRQYSKLIDNKDFISEPKKFSINSDRVDEFISRFDSNCTSLPYSVSW